MQLSSDFNLTTLQQNGYEYLRIPPNVLEVHTLCVCSFASHVGYCLYMTGFQKKVALKEIIFLCMLLCVCVCARGLEIISFVALFDKSVSYEH